jgi:hypothetical protein
MKIFPVGAELFHADERTDMTKLIVAFRNFANWPKNVAVIHSTAAETRSVGCPSIVLMCNVKRCIYLKW